MTLGSSPNAVGFVVSTGIFMLILPVNIFVLIVTIFGTIAFVAVAINLLSDFGLSGESIAITMLSGFSLSIIFLYIASRLKHISLSDEQIKIIKKEYYSLQDTWLSRARKDHPAIDIDDAITKKADKGEELTPEEKKILDKWAGSLDEFQEHYRGYIKGFFDEIQKKYNLSEKHLRRLEKRYGFIRSPKHKRILCNRKSVIRKIFYWVFFILGVTILGSTVIKLLVFGLGDEPTTLVPGFFSSIIFFYIASRLKGAHAERIWKYLKLPVIVLGSIILFGLLVFLFYSLIK